MPVAVPAATSPYRVVVIGEGPGEQEDHKGIPFVGQTGQYLRDHIPIDWRKNLYWSNTVRCRPPKNRKPTPEEISCCSLYQERDLDLIKPHAILAIGDFALKFFWPSAWVSGMRGIPFPVQLKNGQTSWCYSTFHPRFVMEGERTDHDTGRTTNATLPVFQNDLKKFFSLVPWFASNEAKVYTPPKNILYPKNEQEVYALFDQLKDPYSVDIETYKLKPYLRDARILTAAFSDGDLTFAFPVNWPGVYRWGLKPFNEIMKRKKRWIAQNAAMEYKWIRSSTGQWEHDFEDTEAMSRIIHQRTGVGRLEFLTQICLGFDVKALTNLDKNRLLEYPIEKVLEYNAYDAWSTYWVSVIFWSKMTQNDKDNYYRIISTIKSTVAMELEGLTVDLTETDRRQKALYTKLQDYEKRSHEIKEVTEYEKTEKRIFSLSGPEEAGHVLVNYCGVPLPKTPKEKQYSTKEPDLQPFAGKHALVDLLLEFREVQKLKSTYVDSILSGSLLGIDGLLHPSYTTCHVITYRLSSEDPNIQNWPKRANKEIRRQIVAPKGYILVAFDYGQLEGRVICMFSGDPALRKAFITNDDIHWKWLYRIIELYPQYMDRLARISGEKEEKNILKAGRTIIKTDFVFASFYGALAQSLSNRTQIPIHIADRVWNEFWETYPLAKIWTDTQFKLYQETGTIKSLTGRVRNTLMGGNEPANTPSQGSAAELVLEAQNALFYRGMTEDFYLLPRVNIHDDLIFILKDDDTLGDYIENISGEIVKPRFPFVNVPLMTECRVGYNWCDLNAVHQFTGPYYESNGILKQ